MSPRFLNQQRGQLERLIVLPLTVSKDDWAGQHIFKVGVDLQRSRFEGDNFSHELNVRRLDPAFTIP